MTRKPRRTKPLVGKAARQQAILALQVAGLSQGEIAKRLGVDRRTITRDTKETKAPEVVADILSDAQRIIEDLYPVRKRVEKYVELGTSAKNEGIQLAATMRVDDLAGIVTEKERIRAKAGATAAIQPMFMLPPGSSVNVSVSTTTTDSGSKDSREPIDVTPLDRE